MQKRLLGIGSVILLLLYCSAIPASRDIFALPLSPTFFVSVSGDDANPGTAEKAWRTIQKAARTVPPGSIVWVRGGTYNEKIVVQVSGNSRDGFISFQNYNRERVIIDGGDINPPAGTFGDCIIYIENKNYLRFVGFEIAHAAVKDGSGIRIYGSGSFLEIKNNKIYDIRGQDAMAITVYGTDGASINHLIIEGNEIHDCEPAASEALTLNGNVEDFAIIGNTVRDVNNIGIDMIGGESWLGRSLVRNGICRGNTVYRARSSQEDGYAAGIYVDGASNIIIEQNRVYECDLGIEIGAENPDVVVKDIIVRNNLIYLNDKAGLVFGGYAEKSGRVTESKFVNNTIWRNNRKKSDGEIWIQHASNNIVQNNIVVSSPNASGYAVLVSSVEAAGKQTNRLDYNLYFVDRLPSTGILFEFKNREYTDMKTLALETGGDAHSLFADPLFALSHGEVAIEFYLEPNSAAIDRGNSLPAAGELDFYSRPRLRGKAVDIGAVEMD